MARTFLTFSGRIRRHCSLKRTEDHSLLATALSLAIVFITLLCSPVRATTGRPIACEETCADLRVLFAFWTLFWNHRYATSRRRRGRLLMIEKREPGNGITSCIPARYGWAVSDEAPDVRYRVLTGVGGLRRSIPHLCRCCVVPTLTETQFLFGFNSACSVASPMKGVIG